MTATSGTLDALLKSDKQVECIKCKAAVTESELAKNYYVCPKCGKCNRIAPRARVEYLVDKDTFVELFAGDVEADPLSFPGYGEKLTAARKKTGENEGVLCGRAEIGGYPACVFVMNAEFMMASMGTVVGDRITALFDYAIKHRLPVVGFAASGGARMQEGILSLMQMTKTSMAVKRHSDAGLFYLICLTDPTMGGVTASFATLGDVIIGEPAAQIGFAGKRVIEQNTGVKLPEEFQSAEFQLKCGFLDGIVPRDQQRKYITDMLSFNRSR